MKCDKCGGEREDLELDTESQTAFCGVCRNDIVLTHDDMRSIIIAVDFMRVSSQHREQSDRYEELLEKLYDITESE